MDDLECTLSEQLPQNTDTTGMHELPPLSIDGIPTSVDKMTQVCSYVIIKDSVSMYLC